MTTRLPARSCLRSLADLILTVTFVPPLTFLKVENSALLAVVRTRRRRTFAPLGTVTVMGTPAAPHAAPVTVAGGANRAGPTVAAAGVPTSGIAAAGPAAAAT